MGKKGMQLLEMLGALVLIIAVVAVGLYLLNKWGYNAPNTLLASTISCNGPAGQGECLSLSCEGRDGWTSVGQYTCDDGLTCCILTDKELWFTPGSVLVSSNDLEKRANGGSDLSIPLNGAFFFSYIPRNTPAEAKDTVCTLKLNNVVVKTYGPEPSCADQAGGPQKIVNLFTGNGATLKALDKDAKGYTLHFEVTSSDVANNINWKYPVTFVRDVKG